MTLSALGIFSAAGAGGGFSSDYELIETVILGSTTTSLTFSSLGTYSSTYKHLQIRGVYKYEGATAQNFGLRFNADTGANYSHHRLLGNGSSVSSTGATSTTYIFPGYITNQFTGMVLDVLDAYSTTKNKTTRSLMGGTGGAVGEIHLTSGNWRNTSSTTSLTLFQPDGVNISVGSRFSLYGIRG